MRRVPAHAQNVSTSTTTSEKQASASSERRLVCSQGRSTHPETANGNYARVRERERARACVRLRDTYFSFFGLKEGTYVASQVRDWVEFPRKSAKPKSVRHKVSFARDMMVRSVSLNASWHEPRSRRGDVDSGNHSQSGSLFVTRARRRGSTTRVELQFLSVENSRRNVIVRFRPTPREMTSE